MRDARPCCVCHSKVNIIAPFTSVSQKFNFVAMPSTLLLETSLWSLSVDSNQSYLMKKVLYVSFWENTVFITYFYSRFVMRNACLSYM